jgi:hypothetical protein
LLKAYPNTEIFVWEYDKLKTGIGIYGMEEYVDTCIAEREALKEEEI